MRTIFLLITLIYIFGISNAQKKNFADPIYGESRKSMAKDQSLTNNNFQIENSKLIWQKVFKTQLDFESLANKLKTVGILKSVEISGSKIMGDLRSLPADFKGAGYSGANTPIIIARSNLEGYVVIDYKEGKYRITIRNMAFVQRSDDVLFEMGEKTNVDIMAIKNGSFRRVFLKSPSIILNYTFTNSFTFNQEANDNW